MGVWGPGNFDSDYAREYLDVWLEKLLAEIANNLSPENLQSSGFLENFGEYKIMPAIDIYLTLSRIYKEPPIEAEVAARWREDYLRAYDRPSTNYPDDFRVERRKVIEETFDNLDAWIAEWSKFRS